MGNCCSNKSGSFKPKRSQLTGESVNQVKDPSIEKASKIVNEDMRTVDPKIRELYERIQNMYQYVQAICQQDESRDNNFRIIYTTCEEILQEYKRLFKKANRYVRSSNNMNLMSRATDLDIDKVLVLGISYLAIKILNMKPEDFYDKSMQLADLWKFILKQIFKFREMVLEFPLVKKVFIYNYIFCWLCLTELDCLLYILRALKIKKEVKYSNLDEELKDKIREIISLPRISEIYGELYKGRDLYGLLEDALEQTYTCSLLSDYTFIWINNFR